MVVTVAVGMSGGGWWRWVWVWVWVAAAGWVCSGLDVLFGRRDTETERERDETKVI